MWGGSFRYETNEAAAHSIIFDYGQPNPNNRVPAPAPQLCPFRPPFNSTAECANGAATYLNARGPLPTSRRRTPLPLRPACAQSAPQPQ